jgi:5-methylcytosine-specific restriction endonuclease McrA
MDHIVPLALGGKNEDRNIQLLLPACNMKKSAKHPNDYMREMGYLI